jgi:hypothetical protein
MENAVLLILAILGPSCIVGGIVGYRKSDKAKGKAVSAAVITAGVAMLVILIFVNPVSVSIGQ